MKGKTLHLPKTKFPMRGENVKRELLYMDRLSTIPKLVSDSRVAGAGNWMHQLNNKVKSDSLENTNNLKTKGNQGSDDNIFLLHDGPPYANGSLHSGHFVNKVLKDFINRFKHLNGYQIAHKPGWDCHGLPIELKVLENLRKKKQSKDNQMDLKNPLVIRKQARLSAEECISNQMKDLKRWGIMARWNEPDSYYTTMDISYELKQFDVLSKLFQNGYVKRGLKPVYWSPSSHTALAEAELEYADKHKSLATYLTFSINKVEDLSKILNIKSNDIRALIWTTTPWSLFSNVCLSMHPEAVYIPVQHNGPNDNNFTLIIAEQTFDSLSKMLPISKISGAISIKGSDLVKIQGITTKHPLLSRESFLIVANHVKMDAGTGIVHTAPSHGHEDFAAWSSIGRKLEECPSPINDNGLFEFTDSFKERNDLTTILNRKPVLEVETNKVIIEALRSNGNLVYAHEYEHRYPYDWRTKKPVLIRATYQWFVDLTKLVPPCYKAIDKEKVSMVPSRSRARIESMIGSRTEWCISRQRVWGVPIPAFYKEKKVEIKNPGSKSFVNEEKEEEILFNDEILSNIKQIFEKESSDVWFSKDISDDYFLPPKYKGQGWKRFYDTLDVWFDSGCSWICADTSNTSKNSIFKFPADVYLEGSDQHRGWFQSSLLTSLAYNIEQGAPYKTLITHGFVVDDKGEKMSKSIGNVIVPDHFINKKALGVDVLRLWAACCDYTGDIRLGEEAVTRASEKYRKIRTTLRYLLGNLYDYNIKQHSSNVENIAFSDLDKWMLHRLYHFLKKVEEEHEAFNFNGVTNEIMRFINSDMSKTYFEGVKDTLYTAELGDPKRIAVQFVMHELLFALTLSCAPITPYLSEDVFEFLPETIKPANDKVGQQTIFQSKWPHSYHYSKWESKSVYSGKYDDE